MSRWLGPLNSFGYFALNRIISDMYSALHRSLGEKPGPMTSEMIDRAIIQQVEESRGLDYKAVPDEARNIKSGDVAKDVAAMANTGGGIIVYGVSEDGNGRPQKRISVTSRVENEDSYSRYYLQAVTDRIHPPVFGVEVYFVGDEDNRVLIVEVPESRDLPHLIESADSKHRRCFAVPVRNGAATRFQTESEIARMYRDRISYAEDSRRKLRELFEETADLGDEAGVWCVGVGIPRYSSLRPAPDNDAVWKIAYAAREGRRKYNYAGAPSALSATMRSARRGLRKWQFSEILEDSTSIESYVGLHDNGAVQTLRNVRDDCVEPNEVLGAWAEWSITDTILAAQQQAIHTGVGDYDFMLGLVWSDGSEKYLSYRGSSGSLLLPTPIMLKKFKPITTSFDVLMPPADLDAHVYGVATDYVNQCGYSEPQEIKEKYEK
ncbi:ATP-binding protein [Corynebacterium belfantii]|uniref:AlbA family DNA-binding domain-containing protein n=1 Tax=Corynebacterium belfantii TaxID=2014537 RepID=UPI0018D3EA9C|nr:ATP-binding protein [Corynebacterium belfantii]MBG9333235.1 ATP-binding protein [Corynebacterium belfantii]